MKKCKGTGKAKGYGCGELNEKRRYGLGFKCGCFPKWLYTTEEGKEIIKKSTIKVKKEKDKERRKKEKEFKEKNKSIQKLIQEARKPFQQWIRKRDANKPCISCGSVDSEIWDAGHFYKAEIYSGLIFDEKNVHKQCRKCNTYLNGNENNYRIGLINRYSIDYVKNLDEIANEKRNYKYDRQELIDIKNYYIEKLKEN